MPPPRKFTDSPDLAAPDLGAPKRRTFTDSPDLMAPAPAAPKRRAFTDSPDVAAPSPAPAPTFAPPKPVPVGEQVRQRFVGERAASRIGGLEDVMDPARRKALVDEAEGTAWAEAIGQPMYPGGSIRAGVSKPAQESAGSRFAVERMARETRAPGAGAAGERLASVIPDWMQGGLSSPSTWDTAKPRDDGSVLAAKVESDAQRALGFDGRSSQWARENMAVPRKTASGRQMLGEPDALETAGLALAAPVLTPLGVADELYRQAKVTMRDLQGLPPAETPEEREGFLPQGDVPAMNLGRAVARAPSALGEIAMETGANIGRNIRDQGLVAGLGKSLGMDKDPVRNVFAGEESAAQGEGVLDSLWRGIQRAPGEAMDLLTLAPTMAYASAKQLGKLGDPTYDPGEVMKEAADVTKDVATGALRSVARTALDPRAEFERGPIGSALNAAMAGGAVRSLASRPLESIARETALLNKKAGMVERTIKPLADESARVYAEAANAERAAGRMDDAVRNMEARFEVAEKAGQAIEPAAYDELNRLREARAKADLDVAATRQAVEAFAGPSAKTEELAKGWARAVEKNPGDVKAKAALAEATARLEAAGVPNKTLQAALAKKLSLESRLANRQRLGSAIEAAARVPSWVATLGTTAGMDGIGYIARRLGDKFPESRYWLNARNNVVPPEFLAIEREGGALQSKASQQMVEMIRAVPDEAKPTVRKFLQSEHSPLEGGYWRPGNDPSRYMFEFRMGKKAVTPRDKYRQQQVIAQGKMPESQTSFERTAYGEMMREAKLEQARALRNRARELEEGGAIVDDLDGAALDLKRAEVRARMDEVDAALDDLAGVKASRVDTAEARAARAIEDEALAADRGAPIGRGQPRNAPAMQADAAARSQRAANALRREEATTLTEAQRMGPVPLRPGEYGPQVPPSRRAGPVLPEGTSTRLQEAAALRAERAALTAKAQELDSLAALRAQGRVLPTEAERAALAKDLRAESIRADDWVAKMDNEQDIVNRYGKGLAGLSRQYTERAKALKMFENAEQIRDLYWPQLYDEAARGKGQMDPLGAVSAADKAKLAPYLKAGAFKANELRRAGVPMTRREAEFGLKTDLAEEALVGLMSFIDDVEMYDLYRKAAETPGLTRTPEQFAQMKAAAVAEHNARVAQQYRGNPRLIAENAIDPVTMKGADDLPVLREWVMVPDEARFPAQVRAKLATGGKADEGLLKYGALGGRYVPADLYYDMVNRRAALEQMATSLNRVNSMWKAGKTVWSPATHARNVLSSALVFAPMAGMSLWNPRNLPHYAAALQDLAAAKKSRLYQLAEQDGVFKGGFGPNELGRNYLSAKLKGAFENVTEPGKRFVEMLGDVATFTSKRGKEARSGAVRAEREMAQKLRDVTDNEQWLRLRQSSPGLASTAAGKAAVESGKASVSSAMDLPGMIYAAEDDLFRYAYYRKNLDKIARERGTSPELLDVGTRRQVALEAREAFIDYENVPGFAQVLRAPFAPIGRDGKPRRGAEAIYWIAGQPFISFSARAIPRVAKWTMADPVRSQLALQMSDRLTDMNLASSGITKDEAEASKAAYPFVSPSSLKAVGEIIPELARDEQGRINQANVGYLSPASGYTQIRANKYDTGTKQAAAFIAEMLGIGVNPLVAPVMEQAGVVPTFSGKPIVAEGATGAEEFAQRASHLIGSYAPPIMPSPSDVMAGRIGAGTQDPERIRGGGQYEQIAAAVEGVPDYRGRERTVPGALGAIASGTKVLGVTLDDALEAEARMVEEQRREIARTAQAATGIAVPRTSMNRQEEREFATDYRKRMTPVLKTFREAVARFPASPVVNRIRRGFRRLDGARNDVQWAERADDLLDEALQNAAEKAAEAKRIRTDAMRQGALK